MEKLDYQSTEVCDIPKGAWKAKVRTNSNDNKHSHKGQMIVVLCSGNFVD